MKGLILAGGAGTRLRPITHTSAKQLVPIANKPILFYVVDDMAAAGIKDIGVVVSPESGGEIAAALGDGSQFGVELTFIPQAEPLGLAHCVRIAADFLGDDDFVMYLGDNMLQQNLRPLVDRFVAERTRPRELHEPDTELPAAQILLAHVDDPRQFGVAEVNAQGGVVRLVEKPADPPSDLALTGVYIFDKRIHAAVNAIEPSARGELEITDAIQWLIDSGMRVDPHTVRGWWKDTGQVQDMLDANRLILDDLAERVEGELIDSRVEGRVVIEPGVVLERATVRGPAIIGAGSRIVDAYIGPYSAIGEQVTIERAEIEYSIVLSGSSVRDLEGRIEASLIGRNVAVGRSPALPKAYRFVVGDNAEIAIL